MDQTAAETPPNGPVANQADDQAIASWYAELRRYVATDPSLAALAPMMAERDEWRGPPGAGHKLHLAVCRAAALDFSGRLEAALVAAVDSYLRRRLFLPAVNARGAAAAARAHADEMDRRSYTILAALPEATVTAMRDWFAGKPVLAGDQVGGGDPMPIDAARRQSNFARFPTATVMDCPHLLEVATDPLVLATVEQHLGTLPTTLGFAAWWSFADKAAAEKTQLFHWDGAFDLRYCKLLIYLTDVDENGGPHVIFEGTHGPAALAALSRRRPADSGAFLQWYMRPEWKTDADASRWIGQPTTIDGPAGTRFLASTRALHKALLPARSDRLMCQAIYGVSPDRQVGDGACRPLSAVRGGTLPSWLLERPFGYVNRLFLERG